MATPRQLAYARQKNYQVAIDTCKTWAAANNVQPWAHLYRLIFAIHTESKGLIYANDGGAYHPDAAVRRPGWDKDENGNPLSATMLANCYSAVRRSFDFPHDAVGNNGGSTGILQQLSQDYVAARFPGKTWGWGSLANTMSVQDACWAFLDRVRVTSDRNYGGKDFDPIIADVLRVQQPLASEVAVNYGADVLVVAKDIINNWGPEYFTKDFPPVTIDLIRTKDSEGTEAWSKLTEIATAGPKGDKGDTGPAGPQGPPGPSGGGATAIPGAVIFENLAGDDSQRTAAVNAYFRDQKKGIILLPSREIQSNIQIETWSGLTLMGSLGVPPREYGQKTRWRYTGSAGSVFKFVDNRGRYNYPSDGSPRDGTVIGIEFVGGSNTDLLERTSGFTGKTLWYWLFHNIGINGLKSGWNGFGTGTTFGSGVSHFQAFADTVIDVGGSENSFFGSEFSFMDSKVIADGKPFVRLRSEKSFVKQIMTTTRGGKIPLVVDGGRGSHVNNVCFDAQDSDPTNGPAIVVNSHDGLDISHNTFKGMARNGGPIIDVRGGRQIVIQANAFLCKAAGPANTPLVKVGAGVGDREVKVGLNAVVDYSGRLVAARLAQLVSIDPTLKVEIG